MELVSSLLGQTSSNESTALKAIGITKDKQSVLKKIISGKYNRKRKEIKKLLFTNSESTNISQESVGQFLDGHIHLFQNISDQFDIPVEDLIEAYFKKSNYHIDRIHKYLDGTSIDTVKKIASDLGYSDSVEFIKASFNMVEISLKDIKLFAPRLLEGANTLNLPVDQLLIRINKNRFTLDDFFKMVDNFKKAVPTTKNTLKGENFLTKIKSALHNTSINLSSDFKGFKAILDNPDLAPGQKATHAFKYVSRLPYEKAKKLYVQLFTSLRKKMIMNPELFLTMGTALVWDHASFIISHSLKYGFLGHLNELLTTVGAFTGLEIYMTMMSAKDAAWLIANPAVMKKISKTFAKSDLSDIEKSSVKKTGDYFRNFFSALNQGTRKISKSVPKDFATVFAATIIPVAIGASLQTPVLAEIVARTVFDSCIIASFFSVWTKARYYGLYTKLFPVISNQIMPHMPKARKATLMTLTGLNIAAGSFSYVWWYDFAHRMKEKEEDGQEQEEQSDSVSP